MRRRRHGRTGSALHALPAAPAAEGARADARPERGALSLLIVGALLVGLAAAGLAVDGARLFTARRDLQNAVDSAALAGATQVDEDTFRGSEGATVVLSPEDARRAVAESLAASGITVDTQVDVAVSETGVTVRVRREVPTTFLRILGDASEAIGATAHASPRTG